MVTATAVAAATAMAALGVTPTAAMAQTVLMALLADTVPMVHLVVAASPTPVRWPDPVG